ncbi:MAG: transposase [Paracoccaceae bacterium]
MSGRKKRFWSDDEKREICDQASTPGISVAQVARRYAVNANLIHKWLKDPRFTSSAATVEDTFDIAAFLPVEVNVAAPSDMMVAEAAPTSALSAKRVDITLSDGRRILVEGPTALASVVGLVQGLMA